MKNTENEQTEIIKTEDQIPAYKEVLKDVDFFSLPHDEREQLKESVKEKMSESEQEAMRMGWAPQEMFRGKTKDGAEKDWVDSDTFLKRIKEEAPIRNERIRKISQENDSYKNQIQEMQRQMKILTEVNKVQLQRSVAKDEAITEKDLKEAKEDNDVDAYEGALTRQKEIDIQKQQLKRHCLARAAICRPTPQVRPQSPPC